MPLWIAGMDDAATPSAARSGELSAGTAKVADNMMAASARLSKEKFIDDFPMIRLVVASSWNRGQHKKPRFAAGDRCHVETAGKRARVNRCDIFVKRKLSKHCRLNGKLPTHDLGEKEYST
jgi:hypothetical protein